MCLKQCYASQHLENLMTPYRTYPLSSLAITKKQLEASKESQESVQVPCSTGCVNMCKSKLEFMDADALVACLHGTCSCEQQDYDGAVYDTFVKMMQNEARLA